MIPFDYQRASTVPEAFRTATGREDSAYLAGGTNIVDHMKLGIATPGLLVDVSELPLDGVDERDDGGLRIGATVRNSDPAAHPLVRSRYPLLSEALLSGASGQLRNVATTGGNLLQRTRCVYFQDSTTPCNKRDPGSGCSAIGGYNRHHAIFGASDSCIAVHPSDMAVALAALDADVIVYGQAGESRIPLEDFYRLPGDTPTQDTVLNHADIVTAVELPPPHAGSRSHYVKVRDRATFAFALVSVAAIVEIADGRAISSARIALGGVAHKPWRARRAEAVLRGAAIDTAVFRSAAETELGESDPLPGNRFKVPLLVNTVVDVLEHLTEERR